MSEGPEPSVPRVLLLGGTEEARALSHRCEGMTLVTSLAGVTTAPARYGGSVRLGGFGGAAGLAEYLRHHAMSAVIDATHPFAAQISANAAHACTQAHVPLLRLERPPWRASATDRWIDFDTVAAAIHALPPGATAFVAAGRSAAGVSGPGRRLILRAIEPPSDPAPGIEVLLARPPFTVEAERDLFQREGVTHLVCKNAGGTSGHAKVEAAAALGLTVHMIRRPPPPPVAQVQTVEAALRWLADVANGTPNVVHGA